VIGVMVENNHAAMVEVYIMYEVAWLSPWTL
jgi:hypothetical protein